MYYFFSKMLSKQVMTLRIAGDSIYILGTGKKAPLKQASGKISDPTRNKATPPFFLIYSIWVSKQLFKV